MGQLQEVSHIENMGHLLMSLEKRMKSTSILIKEIAIPQALTMESITLREQKREKVPRISGEEALILLGLAKTRITTKTNEATISKANNSSTNPLDESSFKVGRMTKSRMIV